MEAHAIPERAAVAVGAPVGARRQEARAEVAVREVQLEPLEAGIERAARGVGIRAVQPGDLVAGQRMDRVRPNAAVRDVRRSAHLPALGVLGRQLHAALPWRAFAALAPGVAELDRATCSGDTSPKPPAAREPHRIRWKSPTHPSTARCCVIGDIAMRLRSVTSSRVNGLKRSGMAAGIVTAGDGAAIVASRPCLPGPLDPGQYARAGHAYDRVGASDPARSARPRRPRAR
ncbi:MAG: hypothetical protein O9345_09725 [Burkholderiaceae bacterium]|nr:hypothetical protein [Burkholderiales bacterium]MCZ8338422.1 hypothetical protein [Burkholderiaceae bacterium]